MSLASAARAGGRGAGAENAIARAPRGKKRRGGAPFRATGAGGGRGEDLRRDARGRAYLLDMAGAEGATSLVATRFLRHFAADCRLLV